MSEAIINLTVSDDKAAIPATSVLSDVGDKVFIDIGSGNVARLSWEVPAELSTLVNNYTLTLSYSNTDDEPVVFYEKNIGKVAEFYIESSLLTQINLYKYKLSVKLQAQGASEDLGIPVATASFWVGKGCGIYVKTTSQAGQDIMRRALTFTRVPGNRATEGYYWKLAHEAYSKGPDGLWKRSDISYEVLTDESGEIIIDINNEPIYIL